ncbi:MAG: MFS transporter [Pseudomonadota bacterium]
MSAHATSLSGAEGSALRAAAGFSARRRKWVFIVAALAFVMDLLDATIVNVAVPAIQHGLQASNAAIQWSLAGYTLAFAVLLVSGGRLGDVYGYRRLFLGGVAGFTMASLLCGLAWTAPVLVGARVLQGGCAALMVPQIMALMQVLYPPAQRMKVMALFGILGGVSAALGPIIGGLLIEADWFNLGWRLVFLINLPVGVASVVAGTLLLPQGRGAETVRLDWGGTLLSVLCTGSMILPLIEGPELHWPRWCLVLMACAGPLLWLGWRYMGWRSRRDNSALVEPALFKLPSLRLGLLCSLCLNGVIPGYLFMLTMTLQSGWKYSALKVSMLCLPVALGAMLSIALLSQRLLPYLGTRMISLGALVTGASLLLAGTALQDAPALQAWLLLAQFGLGLGLGLSGPPLSALALQDVPLRDAGSASGLVSAVQQVAGALGVAGAGLGFFTALEALAGSSGAAPAQARACLTVLPGLLAMLAAGLLASLRLPPLHKQSGAAMAVH